MIDTVHLFYDNSLEMLVIRIAAPHCVTLKVIDKFTNQSLYFHFRSVDTFRNFMDTLNEQASALFALEGGGLDGTMAAS